MRYDCSGSKDFLIAFPSFSLLWIRSVTEELAKTIQSLESSLELKERHCEDLRCKIVAGLREIESSKLDAKTLQAAQATLVFSLTCLFHCASAIVGLLCAFPLLSQMVEIANEKSHSKALQTNLLTRVEEVKDLKCQVDNLSAQLAAAESMNSLAAKSTEAVLFQLGQVNFALEEERKLHNGVKVRHDEACHRIQEIEVQTQRLEQELAGRTCCAMLQCVFSVFTHVNDFIIQIVISQSLPRLRA